MSTQTGHEQKKKTHRKPLGCELRLCRDMLTKPWEHHRCEGGTGDATGLWLDRCRLEWETLVLAPPLDLVDLQSNAVIEIGLK